MTSLALKSFVRLMPKQGHDEWRSLAKEISDFFEEVEIETVKEGYREVATTDIDENNYQEIADLLNKRGLIFTPLDKINFSCKDLLHTYKKPEKENVNRWHGCVTKEYEKGQEFKKVYKDGYQKNVNHKKIGKMLGYPECCIDYFNKNFKKNYDPVWVEESGKTGGYPECNNILHYFGVRLSSHLSCSPKCEETKKIGTKYLEIMRKKNVVLSEKIYELLSTEMTWDSYHGVVQIETPYFVGVSNTFPYLEKKRVINFYSVSKK